MAYLQVILPARSIPDGQVVRKAIGGAVYTLRQTLKLYNGPEGTKEITPLEDTVFLVGPRGDINQIKSDTQLIWVDVSLVELVNHLDPEGQLVF